MTVVTTASQRSRLPPVRGWPEEFRTRYREAGLWTDEVFADFLTDRTTRFSTNTAVVGRDAQGAEHRWTYADLAARADRAARTLRDAGVAEGDRVILALPNVVEFVAFVSGCFAMGAVPVFAQPGHREAELTQFCLRADAAALVVCGEVAGHDHRALARRVAASVATRGGVPPALLDVQQLPDPADPASTYPATTDTAVARPGATADDVALLQLAREQLARIRTLVGDGAFHVAGWSLGGMAAQQVAALARSEGQQVGMVLALDAYPSDQWAHLEAPDEAEALRGILRMGGVEPLLAADVEPTREVVADLLREGGSAIAALPEEMLAGCITSVIGSAAIVRDSHHQPLPGDLHLVVATAPRAETWLAPYGWKQHVEGDVTVHEIPVTHGELLRRPAVDEVGALITGLVEQCHG